MNVQRHFVPGSKWVFFKLYTSLIGADKLIALELIPWMEQLVQQKIIIRYFYIRYHDPDFHIRLRMELSSPNHFTAIFNDMGKYGELWLSQKRVWNIQCDTYIRELERYGEETMESAESVFCADSWWCHRILLNCMGQPDADRMRWKFAFLSVDNWLEAMGFDLCEKAGLMGKLNEASLTEFGLSERKAQKQLNKKYREWYPILYEILENKKETEDFTSERFTRMADALQNIRASHSPGSLGNLAASFIHMSLNRLFCSRQRECELVLYHFLAKYYRSLEIRKYGKL